MNAVRFGKYELLEIIGAGGMAEVWKARPLDAPDQLVAIKRLLAHLSADRRFVEMFVDEAELAIHLRHPNIVRVLEHGLEGSHYFIVMEHVAGKDLRAIQDAEHARGRRVPAAVAVHVMTKAGRALHHAHGFVDPAGLPLDLIHRDVSPHNVLVSFSGEVKVIDFGLAKAAGERAKTQAGMLKGKLAYMAPEQATARPLDRRTDVFALGICTWEMLTGQRAFLKDTDLATLQAVQSGTIDPPSVANPELTKEIDPIVMRALAPTLEARTPTAGEVADELEAFARRVGGWIETEDMGRYMRGLFSRP